MHTKDAFLAWAAQAGACGALVARFVADVEEHEEYPWLDTALADRVGDFELWQKLGANGWGYGKGEG